MGLDFFDGLERAEDPWEDGADLIRVKYFRPTAEVSFSASFLALATNRLREL